MSTMQMNPLIWFKPDPKQVRKHSNEEEDRQLTESIRVHGILQPPGVLADGTGVFGHRRVRCALAAGMKETLFYILDRPMSESEVRIVQLSENIQRQDLADVELYLAVKELMALNPTWQRKDVAAKIHKSASMATRIFCVDDLIPAAREAFLAGAFGFSKAYTIFKAKTDQGQHQMLATLLSGTSRDEGERQGRQARNGSNPAVRLSRVKIAMPQGATVVVSGNDLSMAEVVELLTETLKEARKAADQYDVKTFQSMMRDRSKAG